ncbi:MAG: hypothetical protein ACYS26_00455 [Planctomycetota bacterium]|jgi:hypothetical protein
MVEHARFSAADTFGGFIGPGNLLEQVRIAVPYLFAGPFAWDEALPEGARLIELGAGPDGWRRILAAGERLGSSEEPTPAEISDYFALCLAAHWATAPSFVPTDVDTKIRAALWSDQSDADELARMEQFALGLADWRLGPFSARDVRLPQDDVLSGHDGERLSVWVGALVHAASRGDDAGEARWLEAVRRELQREADAFDGLWRTSRPNLDGVRAASLLTHNAGDVNQALESPAGRKLKAAWKTELSRLAQEEGQRFGGAYARAAAIYNAGLSAEGHRNYPLRKAKPLRAHPELLLPIGPFLDAWGERLATSAHLSEEGRGEVLAALLTGCRKVAGQSGYFRALAGFAEAWPGGLEDKRLGRMLSAAQRRELKDSELRKRLQVSRGAFESGWLKRGRQALGGWR